MFSGLSYGEIENIATQLDSKATSMETILNAVSTELNKVGNEGTWSGTAAATAKQEFDALKAKFPEFKEAITTCAKYLKQTVERYKAVDAAAQQAIGK